MVVNLLGSGTLVQPFRRVKINEDPPKEKSKGYFFRACWSQGVSHVLRVWAETQRQAEEWEIFVVEKEVP